MKGLFKHPLNRPIAPGRKAPPTFRVLFSLN